MSIVVEQTLPYTRSELNLDDKQRWSSLFPLIRPSVQSVQLRSGDTALLDTSLIESKNVLLAALGKQGSFSSRILNNSHLTLFSTEETGKSCVSTEDIYEILRKNGHPTANGLVVIRIDSKQEIRVISDNALEVMVFGELEFDHVLSLLSSSSLKTRSSFEATKKLLERFVQSAVKTTSTFHEQKNGDNPSLSHAAGISDFESAKKVLDNDLSRVLSLGRVEEGDICSVHFSDISGLSRLEINICVHEVSAYFEKKNIPVSITQSTILNSQPQARGWAISSCSIANEHLVAHKQPSNDLAQASGTISATEPKHGISKIQITDAQVRKIIISGCESVIRDEPLITEYDTIVGDGDCGYTLRDGAKQVLNFIKDADLSKLPSTLSDLVDDLEISMGGTSGALYCIFLSSLALNLWEAPTLPGALQASLDHLLKYTRARLGDRTCLDCLIPFVETLGRTGDSSLALKEAEKGVETTKKMEAKVGRSSYLDEAATRGVPDPGAYGLLKLLEGMVAAQ